MHKLSSANVFFSKFDRELLTHFLTKEMCWISKHYSQFFQFGLQHVVHEMQVLNDAKKKMLQYKNTKINVIYYERTSRNIYLSFL